MLIKNHLEKIFLLSVFAGMPIAADEEQIIRSHAIGIHSNVKYGPDFHHFDYVNPNAPKGGELRLGVVGTFDNLNPFILKGTTARGARMIYPRLCTKSLDEPLSEYGQLARLIEYPTDRSWVMFHLRPEARWHDGKPITIEDVIFTFETLITEGTPFYRSFYADVDSVEVSGEHAVTFRFKPGTQNRELPLILGQLRILPKHYWKNRDFSQTTLDPPLGSGPYRIAFVDPGHTIIYERVSGMWDENIPVQRGQNNFDIIRYEYYRDETIAKEAFDANEYDVRFAENAVQWTTSEDIDAVRQGLMIREMIPHKMIRGMSGFVFNTRLEKFSDRRVRMAIGCTFDFDWTNKVLFHDLYKRTQSYFENSKLASTALPIGEELHILNDYRNRLSPEIFLKPSSDPSAISKRDLRSNLQNARQLLATAGWTIKNGHLSHKKSGEAMQIEFLLVRPFYERVIAPMRKHLQRLGIKSTIRTVDSAQYWNRLQQFDYDIIVRSWNQYLSPGNEQRNYWTTAAADAPGSRNYPGIKNPVIDELVGRLIAAQNRETQIATARALDRVLLWGQYVIPHWHSREHRVLYWNKFGRPEILPANSLAFIQTWWFDQAKADILQKQQ